MILIETMEVGPIIFVAVLALPKFRASLRLSDLLLMMTVCLWLASLLMAAAKAVACVARAIYMPAKYANFGSISVGAIIMASDRKPSVSVMQGVDRYYDLAQVESSFRTLV